MGKVILDEDNIPDNFTLESLDRIARFFSRLDDPYRMPETMVEWLKAYNEEHKVDTVYQVTVGYSHNAMALRFTFKRDMIFMEFVSPDGMRLMEIRLHAL